MKSLIAGMCLVVLIGAVPAGAGILADFLPEPGSPLMPELIWDGNELFEGPGAIGTGFGIPGPGDGQLPTAQQNVPGLLVETPITVPGIPGSEINAITGATTCYDATLDILPISGVNGLVSSGPAVVVANVVIQPLGDGAFEIWSTDPIDAPDVENPVLLLAGTIEDAVITGILGSSTGATLSATVTYNAGAIIDELGILQTGEFSWSLLEINLPLAIDLSTNRLRAFEANAVGQFNGIPEPVTMSLLAIGGLATLKRRRRRK